MSITPLEVRKQEFANSLNGFNKEEVKAYLDMVAGVLEQQRAIVDQQNTQMSILNARLEEYQKLEKNLQATLLLAQKVSEETRQNAQKEADMIIKDAQMTAAKIVGESQLELTRLKKDILELLGKRDVFIVRLKQLINSQMEFVRALEEPVAKSNQEPGKV